MVKNKHQKNTCLDEIGLCAHNIHFIIGSIVKRIGGPLFDCLMRKRIFTLTSYDVCISTPNLKLETIDNC